MTNSDHHIGKQYNRLTVLEILPKTTGCNYRKVIAQCECGETRTVFVSLLISGGVKECLSCAKQRRTLHGHATKRSGTTPEYVAWSNIRGRCLRPSHPQFGHYGGRGILLCERWMSFANFLSDMGPRPSAQHSIDRIDNNKGYEPSNCRWATWNQQCNNKRVSTHYTALGRTQTLAEWAKELKMLRHTLHGRLQRGWTIERAFSTPALNRGRRTWRTRS